MLTGAGVSAVSVPATRRPTPRDRRGAHFPLGCPTKDHFLSADADHIRLTPRFQPLPKLATSAVAGVGDHRLVRQPLTPYDVQHLQRDLTFGLGRPLRDWDTH